MLLRGFAADVPNSTWILHVGQPSLTDVRSYQAECVNPPDAVKSLDWINSGFEGASC